MYGLSRGRLAVSGQLARLSFITSVISNEARNLKSETGGCAATLDSSLHCAAFRMTEDESAGFRMTE